VQALQSLKPERKWEADMAHIKEITLRVPAELLKAIEDTAKTEKVNLSQWIQTRIIGQITREAAFLEVFDKAPPTLRMDFVRDQNGQLLEGDELFMVLLTAYKKLTIKPLAPRK
jgi:hypothetical protein